MQVADGILAKFADIEVNPFYAFADKKRRDTTYATHGYHRYPAKFIPQIVETLMGEYTKKGDLVIDPFGGCGTTLVESKLMGRESIGTDINDVAVLIAKAKINPIKTEKVSKTFGEILGEVDFFATNASLKVENDRIDYWFREEEKIALGNLLLAISKVREKDLRNFFYCGFSNILKDCSIWHQKSNKPTRSFSKIPANPVRAFTRQIKAMSLGNEEYNRLLEERGCRDVSCKINRGDARKIASDDNAASLIVTSPPYVTSYEYADLHQLTALWLEYAKDLKKFRKKFIGTAQPEGEPPSLSSSIAQSIVDDLGKVSPSTAKSVGTYFGEMNQVFAEMRRILKPGGRACIVIGNTQLKKVDILNAEVFTEQMCGLGFEVENIIKREIPSKNLPSTRDVDTGRFVKTNDKKVVLAYPTEYILVMRKA